MIKKPLSFALLLLIFLFSVICQAEPSTERFIVELKQSALFPNESISIKYDQHTLPNNPPDIADTEGCARQDSPSDDQPVYGLKTTIIESISCQWLYDTYLLVGYELILTSKDSPLISTPYSLQHSKAVVTVGWLLKSFWNPDSTPFKPIEQKEVHQVNPFAINAMKPGSGNNQQSHQPSESTSQQAPEATHQPKGYFTNLLYSDYAGGNEGPPQLLHTLSENCFVFPCHGVCSFRPSSDNRGVTDWTVNSRESSTANPSHSMNAEAACATAPAGTNNDEVPMQRNLPVSPNDSVIITALLSLSSHSLPEKSEISFTPNHFTPPLETSSLGCLPSKGGNQRQQTLSKHKRRDHFSQRTCDVTVIGKGGQQQTCGKVFKSTKSLSDHKRGTHSGQQSCAVTVVGKDGKPRPCGVVCKNAGTLSAHKTGYHTGQKNCDVMVSREGEQPRPCGILFENARALSDHKRRAHTVQKACDLKVVGEDGEPQPCGMLCKNAGALSAHKSKIHSKPQTCDKTVTGEDGQPRPCGIVCKNAGVLSSHKSGYHRGQKTCNAPVIGEDGQPRSCGLVFENADAITKHKRKAHSGQCTCDFPVIEKDGRQRRCGKVCWNAHDLTQHKRIHRKRKHVDINQSGNLDP
ncbi:MULTISPECIES: hypothetical protein [unclassified Endozoicomonas]|uniref:hypothetical protein n=1 Tax=unclassified Endozoicomonas TaxID=2644528 RepID=UPI0021494F06|nr:MULTISPECIES: hypothetical protein [unclassified Endozoicomonas]